MGWYYEFILITGAILIIPFLSAPSGLKKNINIRTPAFITNWLNPRNYVWLAGIRRYWFITGLLYISSFIFLYNPFISIGFIFVITICVVPSFYLIFEPLIFIECQNISSDLFLFWKVVNHFTLYMLFLSPFLLIYIFIHTDHYLLILGNILIALFLFIWLNYFKYYVYRHISNTPMSYKYLSMIGALLVPLFFPFLFIIMLMKWKKFSTNIGYYIND